MKIAQIAPLWKPVPPKGYGGSEYITSLLSETLVELGHDVTLFACGGSKTSGKLEKVIPKPMFDILGGFDFSTIQPYDLLTIAKVIKQGNAGKFDIIHSHNGGHHVAALLAAFSKVPLVSTVHGSVAPDFLEIARESKNSSFVSISNSQRSLAPYLNYVDTIYHGIDINPNLYNDQPDDYLIFVGTIGRQKGLDRAIKIAKHSNKKLLIIGDIRDKKDYQELASQIDGKQIVYLGEVSNKKVLNLMSRATALIFPIRWSEAFGLVVAESLSVGTPVIAWSSGSSPELIDHGKTGFLVESISEAVKAVQNISSISRQTCYKTATTRFDRKVMARNYVKVYERLVKANKT